MRARLLLLLLAAAAPAQEPDRGPLTLAEVLSRPGSTLPRRFAFAPDGRRLAYLRARTENGVSDLWAYDLVRHEHEVLLHAPGVQKLTAEERSARERRRERGRGITEYHWNPGDGTILVPLSGDLHVLQAGELERWTSTRNAERNARWSPDGKSLAFVRGGDLYVRRADGTERLTPPDRNMECGLPEFVAMEELGRHEGFWWSPDSRHLVYQESPRYRRGHFMIANPLDPRGGGRMQAYPKAGDANVAWTLRVVPASGGKPVRVDVADEYLVRVDWTPAGRIAVQVSDRAQKRLRLYLCSPDDGAAELALAEEDDAWVAFHHDARFLADGRILWPSERSGRRHLYLLDRGELRALTSGAWDVGGVVAVDEEEGLVFVHGAKEGPRERHLYAVPLGDGEIVRLTREPGWHQVVASEDARWFVDTWSRAGAPPRVDLRDRTGASVAVLGESREIDGLPRPEFVTVPGADGAPLAGMLLRARRDTPGPGLVYTYGGPGSQLVRDRWGGSFYLWHTRQVQRGTSVLVVDGRGSGGYGRAFTRVVAGEICTREAADQAAAAKWLAGQPEVDGARIGVWGWSYGGTLALTCLLDHRERFAAGVAIAPVSDWRDYDTAYTERYLGLPAENPGGYARASPLTRAAALSRPLLLVHGFLDDNVHFRGTAAFLDAAQRAGRLVDMDFYPRGGHGIGGVTERMLLFRRMERFFDVHLGR